MAAVKIGRFRKVGMIVQKLIIDDQKVVQVRCQGKTLDKYFTVFTPTFRDRYCVYPKVDCDVGDFVVIKNLPYQLTANIHAEVDEQFFKLGETYCPVTGRRCSGTSYTEEIVPEKQKKTEKRKKTKINLINELLNEDS